MGYVIATGGNTTGRYYLTDTCNKPRIAVKVSDSTSYIPMNTTTTTVTTQLVVNHTNFIPNYTSYSVEGNCTTYNDSTTKIKKFNTTVIYYDSCSHGIEKNFFYLDDFVSSSSTAYYVSSVREYREMYYSMRTSLIDGYTITRYFHLTIFNGYKTYYLDEIGIGSSISIYSSDGNCYFQPGIDSSSVSSFLKKTYTQKTTYFDGIYSYSRQKSFFMYSAHTINSIVGDVCYENEPAYKCVSETLSITHTDYLTRRICQKKSSITTTYIKSTFYDIKDAYFTKTLTVTTWN